MKMNNGCAAVRTQLKSHLGAVVMLGDDYLLGQIVYSIHESSDDEQYHYAQRMFVRRFCEEGREEINVIIHENESVELYVPMWFEPEDTKRFLDENGQAILDERKRRFDEDNKAHSKAEPLTYESKLPLLGKNLPIRVMPNDDVREVFLKDDTVYMKAGLDDAGICASLLKLCRNMAYEYLKPKVGHFAKLMGVDYSRLEIDDGRRTWGSYHDIDKSVTFSRRLLLMSEDIIDFLIVHELAHFTTLRHDEELDFEMGKILPDHEERDEVFYDTCRLLMEQGWI